MASDLGLKHGILIIDHGMVKHRLARAEDLLQRWESNLSGWITTTQKSPGLMRLNDDTHAFLKTKEVEESQK